MHIHGSLLVTLALIAACAPPQSERPDVTNQFDHVMVGIADLDAGVTILQEMTGVTASYGGVHSGRDTRNALLSLGDGVYFELIAPQAGLQTITDPIAEATLAMQTPTPMHWAIATSNIEATRDIVRAAGWNTTEVDARSRATPDGSTLSWRMFFITEDLDAASIPFFIEWGEDSAHPSQTSPEGCALSEFIVYTPAADRMAQLLEVLQLDITIRESDKDTLNLVLDCGRGGINL